MLYVECNRVFVTRIILYRLNIRATNKKYLILCVSGLSSGLGADLRYPSLSARKSENIRILKRRLKCEKIEKSQNRNADLSAKIEISKNIISQNNVI